MPSISTILTEIVTVTLAAILFGVMIGEVGPRRPDNEADEDDDGTTDE